MNNEEKIKEEIGKTLCEEYPNGCEKCWNNPYKWEEGCCSTDDDIDKLYDAGYRNAKQTIKEFVEKLKERFLKHYPTFYTDAIYEFKDNEIDELVKELYGE